MSTPGATAEPSETPAGPQPWTDAPTDGTWAFGDVSFGQETPIRQLTAGPRDEYTFVIDAIPTTTTDDDGENVTVSSSMLVTRVNDRGFGEPIADSESIFFRPGETTQPTNESYGTYTDVDCEQPELAVGEQTTCLVSFEAVGTEVANSFWVINGLNVAAWPSQTAS